MTRSATWLGGLLACAILAAPAAHADEARAEKLLGLAVDEDGAKVTFDVWTTGCTQKTDFRVDRAKDGFTLIRVRRDTCKAMPDRTRIAFTFAELGLKPHATFTVGNRFATNGVAAAID